MAWTAARDQLATLIASSTPTVLDNGLPSSFLHLKEAGRDGAFPDSRTFWFELSRLSLKAPVTTLLPQRIRAPIDVVIAYRDILDPTALFEAIASDWLLLSKRLMAQANWSQPTSTIESLALGNELISEAEIERDERGALLVIHLTAEFKES